MQTPHNGKVFGIGFHKTATTSLGVAVETLGYRCRGVTKGTLPYIIANNLEPVFALVDQYDAFQDNPWPLLFRELDHRYPGSRFILTVRDPKDWLASIVNHFGTRPTEMRNWIYGVGSPIGNEAVYLQRYLEHNTAVMRYFRHRPEDLLVMDICDGDGWEALCPFLGHSIPEIEYPRKNVRRGTRLAI